MAEAGVNTGRMLVGGVVAGIIMVVSGGLLQVALGQNMLPEGFQPMPPLSSQVTVASGAIAFLFGMWAIWLYTAIRPRYGPGPMTAASAGMGTWLLVAMVGSSAAFTGGASLRLTLINLGIFFVSIVVATLVGASLYQEDAPALARQKAEQKSAAKPAAAASQTPAPAAAPKPAPRPAPAAAAPKPAPPPPKPASVSVPVEPLPEEQAEIEKKHQEIEGSMMAMELNDEVAVREVLRAFGPDPLSLDEIVAHLGAVGWNFAGADPKEVVTNALNGLVSKGKAAEQDGKYVFSR